MSNKCSSCGHFASVAEDDDAIEVESAEVEEEPGGGTVHLSLTITLRSGCCGEDMRTTTLEADERFEHTCEGREVDCEECGGEGERDCVACEGVGELGEGDSVVRCEDCDGTGKQECDECLGQGTFHSDEPPEGEDRYSVDEGDIEVSFTSRTDTTYYDRRKKMRVPVKSYRYARQYYGAELVVPVHCSGCDEDLPPVEMSVEEQASGFEDC